MFESQQPKLAPTRSDTRLEKPVKLRGHLLYLAETGCDPASVLAGSGVSLSSIEALQPVNTGKMAELFHLLAIRTASDFAIKCGLATRFQYMGILGYRLINCTTVREVIDTWNKYSIVISYPLSSRLRIFDQKWSFEFWPRYALTDPAMRLCMETTLAGAAPSIGSLSGHRIEPTDYGFPFPAPDDLRPYELLRPASVCFDQDFGYLRGSASDMSLRMNVVDPGEREMCDDYIQSALRLITRDASAVSRVNASLGMPSDHVPTAFQMASRLGCSLSTLQRQLSAEGVSYHGLLDAFRCEQACLWLDQRVEPKVVAFRLGFADVSSFRRAFRRWTGQTPVARRRGRSSAESDQVVD